MALIAPPPVPVPVEEIAMSRLTFGPRPAETYALMSIGLPLWLEAQLNPPAGDDASVNGRLAQVQIDGRPLGYLNAGIADLWALADANAADRNRPLQEAMAAAYVRGVYGDYQLKEVMTKFWLNHFNVSATKNLQTTATYLAFDRDAVRPNCLGNFRVLLGAVAKSTAMLYYLDNQSSAKPTANENFARELMELHTLGIASYLGRDPISTPTGATAPGYTDADVQAAAKCFTGWTAANGNRTAADGTKTNTGAFIFSPPIHDTTAKTLLGLSIPANGGIQEGESVLDVLARHPNTARFIATKLCRQLVADDPPASIVDKAAAAFMAHLDNPKQIAEVVRAIVFSPEFALSPGQKLKDPFQLVVSFFRATGMPWAPGSNLVNLVTGMGFAQFQYPSPDGLADTAAPWTGTSGMLTRWNAMYALTNPARGIGSPSFSAQTPPSKTSVDAVNYWVPAMLAYPITTPSALAIYQYAARLDVLGAANAFTNPTVMENGLRSLVAAIGAMPEFQVR